MDSVEQILASLSLPLPLPDELFNADGPNPFPDIDQIISCLPPDLRAHLNLEESASHKIRDDHIIYRVTLNDGDYLKITVHRKAIVEIAKNPILRQPPRPA